MKIALKSISFLKKFSFLNKNQLILFFVATLMWVSVKSWQFMMKSHAMTLTNDISYIASIVWISWLIWFIWRFPLGIFSDFFKNKVLVLRLVFSLTLITWIFFLIYRSPELLYLYNLAMWISICTWVTQNVLFNNYSVLGNTVLVIWVFSIANNIGSYLWPMVWWFLIENKLVDWQTQFDFSNWHLVIFALIVMFIALLLTFFLDKEKNKNLIPQRKINKSDIIKQLLDKKLWFVSIWWLVITFMKYATLKYSFETIVSDFWWVSTQVWTIDANYDILHAIAWIIAWAYFIKKIWYRYTIILWTFIMSLSLLLAVSFNSINIFLLFNLIAWFWMWIAYVTLFSMSIIDSDKLVHNTRMWFFQSIYMLWVYFWPKAFWILSWLWITLIVSLNLNQNIYIVCSIAWLILCLFVCFWFKNFDRK